MKITPLSGSRLGATQHLGIPVSMANESLPSLWRLRETQNLISGLKASGRQVFTITDMVEALNRLPANRWTDLLGEGLGTLAAEIGDKGMHLPDVIEWIAEWTRDARSEPRGLLLMTAHRAKGLEFRDVVILDGDWSKPSKDEDADGPRRLFYVAMTRAKSSLAILATGSHPLAPPESEGCLWRDVKPDLCEVAESYPIYITPDMKLVDLSWAGRLRDGAPELLALAQAQVGDVVNLAPDGDRWILRDQKNRTLARMSKNFAPPLGKVLTRAEIGAVIRWRKTDNEESYQIHIKRDEWEAVLPDLQFSAR